MNVLASANAIRLIDKYCYESPKDLNLEELLYAENLKLKEENLEDCEGRIVFNEETGIITVDKKGMDTQKRFTIAHEMGHFFNEKGNGHYKCGYDEFYGNKKNYKRESDANDFAAEILMHKPWFLSYVNGKKLNGCMLKETANYFDVSLTAAAIRYSEVGTRECAVVFSKEGIIKWSSISKTFPHQFIKWGANVSKLSYAYDIFEAMRKDPSSIYQAENISDPLLITYHSSLREAVDVPAEAWFPESFYLKKDERVSEFNVPMKNYNSVLTVLWYV